MRRLCQAKGQITEIMDDHGIVTSKAAGPTPYLRDCEMMLKDVLLRLPVPTSLGAVPCHGCHGQWGATPQLRFPRPDDQPMKNNCSHRCREKDI